MSESMSTPNWYGTSTYQKPLNLLLYILLQSAHPTVFGNLQRFQQQNIYCHKDLFRGQDNLLNTLLSEGTHAIFLLPSFERLLLDLTPKSIIGTCILLRRWVARHIQRTTTANTTHKGPLTLSSERCRCSATHCKHIMAITNLSLPTQEYPEDALMCTKLEEAKGECVSDLLKSKWVPTGGRNV